MLFINLKKKIERFRNYVYIFEIFRWFFFTYRVF